MTDSKKMSPIVLGTTAAVVGGAIIAAVILAASRQRPNVSLDDAENLIAKCRANINEIEITMERLREQSL